jgi:hypothetical protein
MLVYRHSQSTVVDGDGPTYTNMNETRNETDRLPGLPLARDGFNDLDLPLRERRAAAAQRGGRGRPLERPRPRVASCYDRYDLGHGLLGKTCLKSLVRWIGVNPGPG